MPELPEVETVARTLAPHVTGRRVLRAQFFSRFVMREAPDEAARQLLGRRIHSLTRHGKFLVLEMDPPVVVSIHLGMTGKLLWNGTPGPYTRAILEFDEGRLVYDDIRQFGRIEVLDSVPGRVARLGPDPLAVSGREFAGLLAARRGCIKPLLLNQAFLRGLGNIYTDEALFRARIHPRAAAGRLSPARIRRLYEAIREVLKRAIETGGSSISDYVDAEGRKGSFQLEHSVYGKEGLPCPVCGAVIRRIVVAQRGTHYCPRCQRP